MPGGWKEASVARNQSLSPCLPGSLSLAETRNDCMSITKEYEAPSAGSTAEDPHSCTGWRAMLAPYVPSKASLETPSTPVCGSAKLADHRGQVKGSPFLLWSDRVAPAGEGLGHMLLQGLHPHQEECVLVERPPACGWSLIHQLELSVPCQLEQ
ncbi:U11/U12 small nuclear ribonucleoprotein 35 kDa protein [Sciurus carolinensis]|uniref:U11/U12 small nuclear ribonucleoprotein 35 kDa protein n=1 Tax=Sciurus carolinensis TaxID=30640 RepID=A0AA41NIT5_SCICA|nr:U11/U12 small nuclear ribonucleoprotein 35 kDa protein [Sciurus carolinensis]